MQITVIILISSPSAGQSSSSGPTFLDKIDTKSTIIIRLPPAITAPILLSGVRYSGLWPPDRCVRPVGRVHPSSHPSLGKSELRPFGSRQKEQATLKRLPKLVFFPLRI